MKGLTNALKGVTGEFELNRVVGAFGATAYVICANGFQAWEVFGRGKDFDITSYCLAFPAGLGVAVGAVAGAVALKDRHVAASRVIETTGAVPTKPPAGPQVPVHESKPDNPEGFDL